MACNAFQVWREAEAERQLGAVGHPAAVGDCLSVEEAVPAAADTDHRVDWHGAGLHRRRVYAGTCRREQWLGRLIITG